MLSTILLALAIGAQTPPPVLATPYVASSGKTIAFQFRRRSDGSTVTATQSLAAPTVAKNGVPLGPLVVPWVTGYHTAILHAMPAGTSAGPADVVTVSAPAGWMNTTGGLVAAMDSIPADVRTGRSAVIAPDTPRTLKPGWNNAHLGSNPYGLYSIPKNWRYRCMTFPAATYDATGQPLTSWLTTMSSTFYSVTPQSGTDQTINLPAGFWAVGWDDLDPAHPTTCGLATKSNLIVGITERPELANPGTNGVGQVRVFEVKQLSTVAQPGPNNVGADLSLTISNATKTFRYANLVIYGPGDFTAAAPTVLDRSDPYAISQVYLDRLQAGAGSLRFVDSLWGYGGQSQAAEIEQATPMAAFSWATIGAPNPIAFTAARPWSQAATPYFYSGSFGEPFPATLGAAIDDKATVLAVPDAATAPVIVGLRLKAGDELMRVLKVDGTAVTVERGTCSTTAVPHDAGPIAVQNRWLASVGPGGAIAKGSFLELVSDRPHGVESGQALTYDGPWPPTVFTNGTVPFGSTLKASPFPVMVTGPNTLACVFPSVDAPPITLAQSYTLPAGCTARSAWPANPALPVEFAAKVCAQVGVDFHVNVPNCASDSMVDAIACRVRDNYPAGRKVYVEFSNEPWNYYFVQYTHLTRLGWWLDPSLGNNGYYVRRSTEVWKRFRDRFGARSGEVVGLLNFLKFDAAGAATGLEYARKLGVPAGAVAIAPYTGLDTGPATQAASWRYDDEQVIDLYCHDLCYNTKTFATWLPALTNVINAYNANYGEHVRPYAYEGGIQTAAPIFNTTIGQALDPATTSFAVASAAPMVPGVPLLCEQEWMTVVSATGFNVTVARGQYGTTAAPHAAGKSIRTAYLERSHDLIYNPNWYFAEQDFYGMLQANGFVAVNSYALSMGAADADSTYGAYHIQTQPHGRGDGSDGLADNRLTLARPGLPCSKGPTVNQDAACVSVRGQAFIDWMKSTKPTTADPNAALRAAVAAQLQTLQASTAAIRSQVQAIQASTGIDDPLAALQANTAAIAGQLQAIQANAALLDGQLKAIQAGNTGIKDQLKAIQDGAAAIAGQVQALQQAVGK